MRAVVIGQGSIGRRHARLLAEAGHDVSVVTQSPAPYRSYRAIAEAMECERPSYAVIANATSDHYTAFRNLADLNFVGTVLIEKPLFAERRPVGAVPFLRSAVAYNLRFHPLIQKLRERLEGAHIISVEVSAGQWLPDWRPGTDYRKSYSAEAAAGGGVLRDLSHEIDLIQWLFGPWRRLAALGGKRGPLEINSDDVWSALFELESGAFVTLQLNYLNRPGSRRIIVICDDRTLVADVTAGKLVENGNELEISSSRDESYRAQHACMAGAESGTPCTLDEGLAVLDTIAAIEHAAVSRSWVEI